MMRRIIAAIIGCGLLWLPGTAHAVNGIGLSPAIREVVLGETDKEARFTMTVSNTTTESVVLKLTTLDFGALDDSGGIAFVGRTAQESTARGLREWMRIEQEVVVLGAGESREVGVIIENKDSLSPGGHYGAVVVSAAQPASGNDSVAVLPAASTLVLLKKTGGENYGVKLDTIKANSSLIKLPRNITIVFKNEGNTHVVPRGVVELKNPFGKLVSRGTINETSSFVLPDSSRRLSVEMTQYKQPWLPGRYRLETTWRYDGTDAVETTVQYRFFLGKITIFLLVFACAVFVLFLYIQARQRPPVRGL